MFLGINYSPAAAHLVQTGVIDVDFFKTPNWDWMVTEAAKIRPVAIHFNLEAGNGSLDKVDWDEVEQQLDVTRTPYVNLHLDARQCYYPEFQTITEDPAQVEAVSKVILSDVAGVVEHFGPRRVIIENSPYQGIEGNTMRLCVLPELISRVVDETGCGLLLDISHAVITASYLGIEPAQYLARLPVQQIKEMHFAGIHKNDITGQMVDHLSILEENWCWLDWVLKQIQTSHWGMPWLLAFEYGGVGEPFKWRTNPQVIAEQVPLLYDHLQRMGG
jgi:uncharacterized protein (UPF0276 family)